MVDAVIMMASGAVISAIGYRLVGPRSGPTPSLDPRHVKAERFYRIAGPTVLLCGAFMAILKLTARG